MVVNVMNKNTLPFLPYDAVIETTCLITSSGAHPLSIETLNDSAQGEIHLLKSYERLTIEAAIKGDYSKALQALTIHPLTRSGAVLKETLDEVLEQNKDYLPQFK